MQPITVSKVLLAKSYAPKGYLPITIFYTHVATATAERDERWWTEPKKKISGRDSIVKSYA